MRLIDADAVLERIELACGMRCLYKDYKEPLRSKMCNCCELGDARMYVEDAPTVDAERHGYWEKLYTNNYKCSVCGSWWTDDGDTYLIEFNYCPNCGAKMDASGE